MVIAEKSFALGNESVQNIQYPSFPVMSPDLSASMITKKIQEWAANQEKKLQIDLNNVQNDG